MEKIKNCHFLQDWEKKKILILGFGREGKDNLFFLRKIFPEKVIGVADQNKKVKNKRIKKIKWHLGKEYLKSLKKYDIIIKSPGIRNEIILPHLKKGALLSSQTEIFFNCYPGKIIGITGTKGKGTVSSLIFQILKRAKKNAFLGGNIEKPVLKYLFSAKKSDLFVYELSSHQLVNLNKSPSIAVFLNLFPAHLDFFKDFNSYKKAKEHICRWQKKEDYIIYNSKDPIVREIVKKSKAKKIAFDKKLKNFLKFLNPRKIKLKGYFNLLNISAAICVAEIFGIKKEIIKKAIENFKGLPHRLEYVGNFKGIDFYNDSQATVPEATIAAIETFKDDLFTLIAGGYDAGVDYKKLAQKIVKNKIKVLILFRPTGEKIAKEIKNKISPKIIFVENMSDAVKLSFSLTPKNKVCLLSPASPSFGLFKNYKERGESFKKLVKKYGKN